MQSTGVIFDFNGTLLWDNDLQEDAWRAMAQRYFGRTLTEADFQQHIHGRNNEEIIRYLAGKDVGPSLLVEIIDAKESDYRASCLAHPGLFHLAPGAIELLEDLRRRQVPVAIATASDKGNVDFYIQHLNLHQWFAPDTILYNDGRFPSKPDPAIYRAAAKAIGRPPQECAIFEDAPSGIQAALNAPARLVVMVRPKYPPAPEVAARCHPIQDFYEAREDWL